MAQFSVSALKRTAESIERGARGDPAFSRTAPGRTNCEAITLERRFHK